MKSVKIEPFNSTECPECATIDVFCEGCHGFFEVGETVYCDDDDNSVEEEINHYHKRCRPNEDDDFEPEPGPFKQARQSQAQVRAIEKNINRADQWRMN